MIQKSTILKSLPNVLEKIDIPNLGKKLSGKVRDFYILKDQRIIITTDRQSAFDVILGCIPYKGAVLNQLAAFWFEKTRHIVPNHIISLPDPNVLIAHSCQPIPVEMIVRGYISGVTKTSIWYSYEKGERFIYGQKFPDGLKKNQKLAKPVITPTTHPMAGSSVHDERLTREEIIKRKIVPEKLYKQMEKVALQLFDYGSKLCKKQGLILVDTKYEFGLYNGKLMLMDEIHTPDSSRFWIDSTYKKRFEKGEEPDNFDKEFLRLWYAKKGYRGDGKPPKMAKDLIVDLSQRYIGVYEKITGKKFKEFEYPIEERIKNNLMANNNEIDKLEVCKQIRKYNAESLVRTFSRLLKTKKQISEIMLRDAWLAELRKNKNLFPDGWYVPPPHGVAVLFGTDKDTSRISPKSLRPQESWSNHDVFLDRENGIVMVYASPVDRKTGIIGDFGLTLYFGKDKKIQQHLALTLQTNKEIFEYVKEGMELRSINTFAREILKSKGLITNLSSLSDPTGTNIGHTIPASYENWSTKEKKLLVEGKWEDISTMISKKRIFLNSKEKLRIKKGMAFTIEPRPQSAHDPNLPMVFFHTIALLKEKGKKELLTDFDELFSLTGMDYMLTQGNEEKITYSQVGDNYETKDPVKKVVQAAAKKTGKNLKKYGFEEVADTRGESAFVWKQGDIYMASVVEGLGTKNLIADEMYRLTGKSYYDIIAHDTVATIINDLITVGATPLVVHAYWAIEDNTWLQDTKRMQDFVRGWANACTLSGASWGGGETATMKQVLIPGVVELAGSAVGIIPDKKRLVLDTNLSIGDAIILLKSNGVNANGISLTRAVAKKLPKGYATLLPNGKTYGESLLTKSNIYAKVIKDILDNNISIHYISNITGHGMRKLMRARKDVTYRIKKIFNPQEIFTFIQQQARLTEKEMYETYNMGMDYALFVAQKDAEKVLEITKKHRLQAYNAGVVEKGPRQVIIEPLDIVFGGETLNLRT